MSDIDLICFVEDPCTYISDTHKTSKTWHGGFGCWFLLCWGMLALLLLFWFPIVVFGGKKVWSGNEVEIPREVHC